MKGGKFYEMTPSKQVSFIERLEKTSLGIEGLQYIVYADKCREIDSKDIINPKYNFLDISKKLLKKINGQYIKQKYKIKNYKNGITFKNKLHEARVIEITKLIEQI